MPLLTPIPEVALFVFAAGLFDVVPPIFVEPPGEVFAEVDEEGAAVPFELAAELAPALEAAPLEPPPLCAKVTEEETARAAAVRIANFLNDMLRSLVERNQATGQGSVPLPLIGQLTSNSYAFLEPIEWPI